MDFKTPNLPGANAFFNAVASKIESVDITAIANKETDAAEVISALKTNLEDLKAKTNLVIPTLPTLPSLNLQAELTALTGLTAGGNQYISKLSSISNNFGSGLTAGGFSLDSIVSEASTTLASAATALSNGTSSVSLSSALSAKLPNFELPPGATEAIEKAKASLLADLPSLKELAHSFSESITAEEPKGLYGDKLARETQASNLSSLMSNLESAGKAFGAKARRLEEKLKQTNSESRVVDQMDA